MKTKNFSADLKKASNTKFDEIRHVGAELFQADRLTDRGTDGRMEEQANIFKLSRFLQFCERA
jgi:hypothetical protein